MNLPTIRIRNEVKLPDNAQWTNRFEVRSETSNRIYIVSQHKTNRYWGCSCPAWRTHKHCKHLKSIGLATHMTPMEVEFKTT